MFRFCVRHDDGARLWVNDQLVVNNWNTGTVTTNCNDILIESAGSVPIRLEYFQAGGDAVIELLWNGCGVSCSQHTQVFTASQWSLFPSQELAFLLPISPSGPYTTLPRPFTTTILRDYALNYPNIIWPAGNPPPYGSITWNRDVGRYFQERVLLASDLLENGALFDSNERAAATTGNNLTVRPDSLTTVTVWQREETISGVEILVPYDFPQSGFVEVKATSGTVTMSYQNYQILGMLDAARSPIIPLAAEYNVGYVDIIMTANTLISLDLINTATTFHTVFCAAVVWEIPGSNPPYTSQLIIAPATLLNPLVELVTFPLTGWRCRNYSNSAIQFVREDAPLPPIPGDPDSIQLD